MISNYFYLVYYDGYSKIFNKFGKIGMTLILKRRGRKDLFIQHVFN